MATVLVVEDDRPLSRGISFTLSKEGHTVLVADTIRKAKDELQHNIIDLILLDINLPDGNGLDFCMQIRENSNLPIIFLTAKDTEEDMVEGLKLGGDDYIAKPFSSAVLKQRILAVLRRIVVIEKNMFTYHNLAIDLDKRLVRVGELEIKLTSTEYKLLMLLVENKGQILTRTQILDKMWDNNGNFVDENALSVNIRRLRLKLEPEPKKPQYIITVFGIGYTFGDS